MPETSPSYKAIPLPVAEVFVSSSATTKAVGRAMRAGTVRKIGPRLYTTNLNDSPEAVIQRNRWRVVALLAPGSVIDFRTAIEMVPTLDIGTLLGSRRGHVSATVALARAAGEPYDAARLDRFQILHAALMEWPVVSRPDILPTDAEFSTISFFDAYFSNFMEGTRFELQEAHDIVFAGKIPAARPQDAHDVLGTFSLVGNRSVMSRNVMSFTDNNAFEAALLDAHARIMAARPDKRPGLFKIAPNVAGHTAFVAPDLVSGTLHQGFGIIRGLPEPFQRAAMMMFVLSEVHPFDDGNGRVARAFMNAELISGGQRRILIPSVYRDEYLTGLRVLTRQNHPLPVIQILDYAQRYTTAVDFSDYDRAVATLRATNGFEDPRPDLGLRMAPP